MKNQTTNPAPETLSIFIGVTPQEQLENLQCIRDVIKEILIKGLSNKLKLSDKAKIYLSEILLCSNQQINNLSA